MFTATLIAAGDLRAGDISAVCDILSGAGCAPTGTAVIEPAKACDISFDTSPQRARRAVECSDVLVDVVVQATADRRRKLIIADMDSTMITIECIDELADYAGIKPQIAAITDAAMRGELAFEAALRHRVALLGGLSETVIDQCLAERVVITGGAKALVRTVKANGGYAVLVSGGFTRFAEPVAAEIGFDRAIANRLGVSGGILDGTVTGAIVDGQTKQEVMTTTLSEKQWLQRDALAVGDGANDIAMIKAAGLGVAFHAKPDTAAAAHAAIRFNDLTALLYAMGYPRCDWVD